MSIPPTPRVTVLQSRGPMLAKTWLADGTLQDYDRAKNYKVSQVEVGNVTELHGLVERLSTQPTRCLIRGTPANGIDPEQWHLRNLDTFNDEPSYLLVIDADQFTPLQADVATEPEMAVQEFVATLPAPLQDAACVYQLSGSCGHPSKGNLLRAHLYYLLAEPLTCEQMEAWAAKWLPGTDTTVHRTVQAIYTSGPVLQPGQVDPLAGRRVGLVPSYEDRVAIPSEAYPMPDLTQHRKVRRDERSSLRDPREKPGLIGALCRAFKPEELPDLFPDHFARGSRPHRMTWLAGGGAREGVCVTDSGTHLYNSHSTAPAQGAMNLFDFIRSHVFGHLDAGMSEDALSFDPAAVPSYRATCDWAMRQTAVVKELEAAKTRVTFREGDTPTSEVMTSDGQADERMAKAERMERLATLIRECPDQYAMRDLAKRISKATFEDFERELLAKAMQSRSLVLGNKMSLIDLRKWLKPFDPVRATYQHLTDEGLPLATLENLEALLAQHDVQVRYNLVLKRMEFVGDGLLKGAGGEGENVALAHILSYCRQARMSIGMTELLSMLTAIAMKHLENPVAEWIASAKWDGQSRVMDLLGTLELDPEQDRAIAYTLLRMWLIQSVAQVFSPTPIQARGVLTLVGPQHKGKSRWLQSLAGPMGVDYFKENHILKLGDRDNIHQATCAWITELGELGGTFKYSDDNQLKAFLSTQVDVYRRPYAIKDSRYPRLTAFAASINEQAFLRDSTGNTRFWPINVLSADAKHGLDVQQLWAEVYDAWCMGERHWLDEEETEHLGEVSSANSTPDAMLEMLAHRFPWDQGERDPESVEWRNLASFELLRAIDWPVSHPRAGGKAARYALQLGAKQTRVRDGYKLYRVPVPKPLPGMEAMAEMNGELPGVPATMAA